MCWLVLLVTIHLELCSSTLMSVAIPQVQFLDRVICLFGVFGQTAQKTVDFFAAVFHRWSSTFRSWCRGRFLWLYCSVDKEIPQLQFLYEVIDAPVVQVVFLPAVAHDRCPYGSDDADSVEVPQVQFLRGGGRRCAHAAM